MDKAIKILVVDDNQDLCDLLKEYLSKECFNAICASDGKEAMELLQHHEINLIILDLIMPGEDGLNVLRRIRTFSDVPVIILSGKGQYIDRIIGIEMGADDYLAKPFNPRELLARIRAILRRAEGNIVPTNHSTHQFGEFKFNRKNKTLSKNGDNVSLTDSESKLLNLFCASLNNVLSRDQLVKSLHGYERGPYDRSIDVHITRLRKKLEPDHNHPVFIRTVWGKGYKFTPDGLN